MNYSRCSVSAYWGGAFGLVVQRVIDVFLGFPFLVLALIMVVALGSSPTSVAIAISLGLAPQVARLSRASALSIEGETYLEAARAVGAGSFRVIWRHLLPNSFPPVLAQVTGYFGAAVVAEAALSFLGLGVPPPFPRGAECCKREHANISRLRRGRRSFLGWH